MKEVLLAGALQPVICLLSSDCWKTQKLAALLIGQFAATDSDSKVEISKRGVIPQLVYMLHSPDIQVRHMSVIALGTLAQETHNQVIIDRNRGLEPLLNILDSNKAPLQRDAALVLYGLADNEGIVANIIKAGGFQKLKDGHFKEPTKECVAATLKRLEEKMQGRVLKCLINLMYNAEKGSHSWYFKSILDQYAAKYSGLELLLDILDSPSVKQKCDASAALLKLAAKIYLGEEYVNNAKLSVVTFLVEGRSFYAHRDCLLSSDVFRTMFGGDDKEKEAKPIVIPNIKWGVFELMMRYLYTGTVDVNVDIAKDLLRGADRYLLDGLKSICEYAIA